MNPTGTSAPNSSAEPEIDANGREQTELHPLVAGLKSSLENRQAVTIGTFAAQVQAIHAELTMMQSQIDRLAEGLRDPPGSTSDAMLQRAPSDQEVDDLSAFLAAP